LIGAWLVFPALLVGLAAGCGLLLEAVSGQRMPGALVPVAGLALVTVVGQLATSADATAELATPLAVALAGAGALVDLRRRGRRPDPRAAAVAVAVFALFGAPVLASGEPTFAGYVKLDDTATWLAITDRLMEHGHSLDGLAPSTYEATLHFNFGNGYPVGAFMPLGIGSTLAGQDPAWTFQPYIAVLGAMLALALYALAAPFVASRPLRAAVTFVAAQPALLVGYSLWGGVKEVAAAALLPLVAGLAVDVARHPSFRAVIPLAVAAAAVVAVLSVGGAAWLAPLLLPAAVALARWIGPRSAARWAGAFIAVALMLVVPALALGGVVAPWARPLISDESVGNLVGPLSVLQVAGVWPSGDFRLDPEVDPLARALIAVTVGAAIGGTGLAVRARAWSMLAYVAGTLAGCAAIVAFGSPWVDGKALAIASPCVLLVATSFPAAYSALARSRLEQPVLTRARSRVRRGRVACGLLFVVIAVGVLWSNALAYREVTLAPYDQLAELEAIGERIAGQGPTLMTEYQPYAARHFLRDADPEAVSELRRRRVPLRGGRIVGTGRYADIDELDPAAVLAYRTLVLRRSPANSRPPAPYRQSFVGEHYEVWQRPDAGATAMLEHRGLGGGTEPTGVPRCETVRRLARAAGSDGWLVAAARPPAITVPLARSIRPREWGRAGEGPNAVLPRGSGSIEAAVTIPADDRYNVWVRGSVRGRLDLTIDGREVGSVRHRINNTGQYMRVGRSRLSPGRHRVTLRLSPPDLHPGSGGQPFGLGPLVLSRAEAARSRIVQVPPGAAERLCGRRWDWVEALG
jgi:hypothetical protein